jgi:hypothetical protein
MPLSPSASPASRPNKAERAAAERAAYDAGVFVNCPFDDGYKPLFNATVFAVLDCGFEPRCALQVYDSGQVRIDKIMKLIEGCRYGVHDISRTELDAVNQLPRFNMPLELGIFLGAQRFGAGKHKDKNCLVLDREPYRYQKFISDIAGQDISAHGGAVEKVIGIVRDWLSTSAGGRPLPGGAAIAGRFATFNAELPTIAGAFDLKVEELTFSNYVNIASGWLKRDLVNATDPAA